MAILEYQGKVTSIAAELQRVRRQRNRWRSRCSVVQNRLTHVVQKHKESMRKVCWRHGKRNISPFGGYSLAIARSKGHASAQTCVSMVAGSAIVGEFKDKHIVTRYEHRASVCSRLRSATIFNLGSTAWRRKDLGPPPPSQEDAASCVAMVPSGMIPGTSTPVVAFCYRGDATNQEAIQKCKVHLSEVSFVFVPPREHLFDPFAPIVRLDTLELPYHRAVCSLQRVVSSTSSELYNMIIKELSSVGCPDWLSPVWAAPPESDGGPLVEPPVVVYGFSLDQGPDNQGMVKMVQSMLAQVPRVMMLVVYCCLHQYHLVVKNVLAFLDSFSFDDAPFTTQYFSGISAVSNCWRSPGHPVKIRDKACELLGDLAGMSIAGKVPGRAQRGRWGSIDNFEALIDKGGLDLSRVFRALFTGSQAETRASFRQKGLPYSAEQDERREHRRAWATMAGTLMSSALFLAMVRISLIAKAPIFRWFCWAEKKRGEFIKRRRTAEANFVADLGETMMSELVCTKAVEVASQISDLLGPGACDDPARWAKLWQLLENGSQVAQAKILIVGLVLTISCSWQMRFVEPVSRFPLRFMVCLASPPESPAPERMRLAADLLAACPYCLRNDPSGDFTGKVRRHYFSDWEHMARTGQCTEALYLLLISVRSVLQGETQEIEGWNHVLQLMAKRSPTMEIALADARLNLKHGHGLSADECCELHTDAQAKMVSGELSEQYYPIADDVPVHALPAPAPGAAVEPPCAHVSDKVLARCASLAAAVCKSVTIGGQFVYLIEQIGSYKIGRDSKFGFFAGWSWHSTLWVVGCDLTFEARRPVQLMLNIPLAPQKLFLIIRTLLERFQLDESRLPITMSLARYGVRWGDFPAATINPGSRSLIRLRARPQKSQKPRPEEAREVPAPAALEDGDIQAEPVDLDLDEPALLEEMLGQGHIVGEGPAAGKNPPHPHRSAL